MTAVIAVHVLPYPLSRHGYEAPSSPLSNTASYSTGRGRFVGYTPGHRNQQEDQQDTWRGSMPTRRERRLLTELKCQSCGHEFEDWVLHVSQGVEESSEWTHGKYFAST